MIVPKLFNIALIFCKRYSIDESHAIGHAMNVLHYSHDIMKHEALTRPDIVKHKNIIYASSILHDVCDKKYVDETKVWNQVERTLYENKILTPKEVDICSQIVKTMSYSKVKKNGFPNLGKYQLAYHIVREADLLTAYDVDRCMIYNMYNNSNFIESMYTAEELFEHRVFTHNADGLFVTEYSKQLFRQLEKDCYERFTSWNDIII